MKGSRQSGLVTQWLRYEAALNHQSQLLETGVFLSDLGVLLPSEIVAKTVRNQVQYIFARNGVAFQPLRRP